MEFFDLKPTYDNIISALEENCLGRNKDILSFISLLNSFDSSCSIALDAQWGAGKTFFVKQVKMVLDSYNPNIHAFDEDVISRVKLAISRTSRTELNLQPFVTVYYDAWLNDNDDDPILSLVYSILESADSDFYFTEGHSVLDAVAGIAEALSGKPVSSILSSIKGKDIFEHIRASKSMEALVTEFLSSLLPERGERLVIFVDELDRCNPAYAVRFLERIKHYFSEDRITFVFSVNIGELQHTIRNHYGYEFDACRYLDRFFDLRLDLPPADTAYYYDKIGLQYNSYYFEKVCHAVINTYNFSLRETAKYYRMAKTAVYKPTHNNTYHHDKVEELFIYYIIPVMIGIKLNNHVNYTAFINGKDGTPLFDFQNNHPDLTERICSRFIQNDVNGVPRESASEFLRRVYEAVFVEDYSANRSVSFANFVVYKEHREKILRIVNSFSEYADYDV